MLSRRRSWPASWGAAPRSRAGKWSTHARPTPGIERRDTASRRAVGGALRGGGARIRVACLLAAVAGLLAAAAIPSPADAAITVFTPDRAVLAKYSAVNCTLTKVKGERRFTAQAKRGRYRLRVLIAPGDFRGFRTYDVL